MSGGTIFRFWLVVAFLAVTSALETTSIEDGIAREVAESYRKMGAR